MSLIRYLCFALLASASFVAQAACLPPTSKHPPKQVTDWYVVDGDTIHIPHRQKLRLAMINAPELGRDGRPDQPFARQAKQAAEQLLHGGEWYWQAGQKSKDRYGRWLGSIVNARQQWLGAHLVSHGLAYVISVGNNVAPACLWQLEKQARKQRLGLWQSKLGRFRNSEHVLTNEGGFMLLRGVVEKVSTAGKYWYVDLAGKVTLKINQQQWLQQGGTDPHAWLNTKLRVRGWVSWRKLSKKQRQKGFKPARLTVQHPHMLQLLVKP